MAGTGGVEPPSSGWSPVALPIELRTRESFSHEDRDQSLTVAGGLLGAVEQVERPVVFFDHDGIEFDVGTVFQDMDSFSANLSHGRLLSMNRYRQSRPFKSCFNPRAVNLSSRLPGVLARMVKSLNLLSPSCFFFHSTYSRG